MKKRRYHNNSRKDIHFYLSAGFRGIKLSFLVLIVLIIIFLVYLALLGFNVFQIFEVIFRIPHGEDYFVIFSGFILFEVIPFILSIQLSRKK